MDDRSPVERLIWRALEPVACLLARESVTEVLVNGPTSVFYEEGGRLLPADPSSRFADDHALRTLLNLLAQHSGRVVHDTDFELDTSVAGPPALRAHVNFGASSRNRVCLSLRRISQLDLSLEDLVERYGSLSREAAEFLQLAIRFRRNILISGGTGSGKTTVLKCLCDAIGADERIVVIEDTPELRLKQSDVVSLLTRQADAHEEGEVTMRDLFRSALRLRPDRILIGEVRGEEALDLIQTLSSGHAGSLCTLHADNPFLALTRLESLAIASGVPIPPPVLRGQISRVIHYVLQVDRMPDASRKVTRLDRLDVSRDDSWALQPVFVRAASSDLSWAGVDDPWLGCLEGDVVLGLAPALAARVKR